MTTHRQPASPPGVPASLAGIEFLTVAETATTMRVSKMTIYRLIHTGELEALQVGRSFRIPVSAAIAYMQSSYLTGTQT
jgi:excisionase family DNA binding protein